MTGSIRTRAGADGRAVRVRSRSSAALVVDALARAADEIKRSRMERSAMTRVAQATRARAVPVPGTPLLPVFPSDMSSGSRAKAIEKVSSGGSRWAGAASDMRNRYRLLALATAASYATREGDTRRPVIRLDLTDVEPLPRPATPRPRPVRREGEDALSFEERNLMELKSWLLQGGVPDATVTVSLDPPTVISLDERRDVVA